MSVIIATIQGQDLVLTTNPDGSEIVDFKADADIDCDGIGGNPFHDPYFQRRTSLMVNGRFLHAEAEPFIVVPPVVIKKTKGIVLGCLCEVENTRNGRIAQAVVGDSGPTFKIGEISPALALQLGLDPNPNHGGTSDFIIHYRIYPGRPATIGCQQYALQPWKATVA